MTQDARGTHQPNQARLIAVVGDVHDQWDATDEAALKHLGVDLVLFVGDFGNEAVEVVRAIAALDLPKAVILGNHDAWYTATPWGRKKKSYDRTQEDRVQQQLDLLGETHVGYGKLDFPNLKLTVIGGRPFSWGGSGWEHTAQFYQARYGIDGLEASTARITEAVTAAAHDTLLFMGHSGPAGLGDRPEDPCGRDWNPIGGDYGDRDLSAAIAAARHQGKTVPLVTFGHMHHQLRHTRQRRRMMAVDAHHTVYLNAAHVPRIIQTPTDCHRNFSLVSLQAGQVMKATLVWLDSQFNIVSEETLYPASPLGQTA